MNTYQSSNVYWRGFEVNSITWSDHHCIFLIFPLHVCPHQQLQMALNIYLKVFQKFLFLLLYYSSVTIHIITDQPHQIYITVFPGVLLESNVYHKYCSHSKHLKKLLFGIFKLNFYYINLKRTFKVFIMYFFIYKGYAKYKRNYEM